ncbi:hypothetical protein E5288_WYG001171 [Bos mutus]|uniref:Uncharacterized protein n=1 Tax=Bos mutus TaxID=72004 RepID=A0A6B0S241_9CETA|nr:hypothetical protein [Bos mutus]
MFLPSWLVLSVGVGPREALGEAFLGLAVPSLNVTAAISRVYRVHSSAPKGLKLQACVLGLPECRRERLGVTCQVNKRRPRPKAEDLKDNARY